jgi:hypothetical protein
MKYFIFIAAFIFLNCFLIAQQNLSIEISCDKAEIIQGESLDILAKIKNNSDHDIKIGSTKHYLYDLNSDSLRINNFDPHSIIEIPAHVQFSFFIDPLHYIAYNGNGIVPGYPWFYWYAGNYDYYIDISGGSNQIKSNKIHIIVNPVPDSLLQAFEELKDYVRKAKTGREWKTLLEKHRGSYYEKEFYYRYLTSSECSGNLGTNEKKEFVIRYPNTALSYSIFNSLVDNYNNNKDQIEDILNHLKINAPSSKLLMVLRNRPDYMNKPIIHLLR